MKGFSAKIDALNAALGKVLCWLILAVVLLTFSKVLGRYIFGEDAAWQSELMMFLHSSVFLGMAAFTLRENAHVRVDVFYQHFPPQRKAWVNLIGSVFLLLPFCVAFAYYSWGFVASSWGIWESSREDNGMGGVFVAKSFILIFCVTLFLQGLSQALKSWQVIRRKGG